MITHAIVDPIGFMMDFNVLNEDPSTQHVKELMPVIEIRPSSVFQVFAFVQLQQHGELPIVSVQQVKLGPVQLVLQRVND